MPCPARDRGSLTAMLFELLGELAAEHGPIRVFGYITVRTALANITALAIGLAVGPWLMRRLQAAQVGQFIREDGPASHHSKAGTPTMGGLLICLATIIPTLLWADLSNAYVGIVLLSMVGFGLIGLADDYMKVTKRRSLGLSSRAKLGLQLLMTIFVGLALVRLSGHGDYSTLLTVPFFKEVHPDLVVVGLLDNPLTWPLAYALFLLFLFLVLVGSSNAVNLTDGLDGLAIGLTVICAGALAALAYVAGHSEISGYLDVPSVPLAGELTVFCGSLVGASLAFLWYNSHPAQMFMGDVGSLSLGGAMGTVAVLAKQEIVLLFIGGVFVAETLSVIAQVASFKLTGKRILRMSPLHHHFEQLGWSESKVIVRFWIAGLVWALLGLSTLKLR